jgi:hypothetical protein
VIYFQVTDPRAATYEVANRDAAVEQLTVTTMRNVVGGMNLETALTSRDQINTELRQELDEATGKCGIRDPDQRLLAYQYRQMLPQIAQGDANKVWIVPSEIGKALGGIGGLVSSIGGQPAPAPAPAPEPLRPAPEPLRSVPASGPGPQFDPPVGRYAGLEGWLASGGGSVHDGPVGNGEGGAVPGAGHAGSTPFNDDSSLV